MFAKTSLPLAKLVRTTEGVLVVLFNVAIVAAAVAGKIAPGTAAQYAGILNSVTVVSRSGLKAVAALAAAQAAQPQAPAHAVALAELVPSSTEKPYSPPYALSPQTEEEAGLS